MCWGKEEELGRELSGSSTHWAREPEFDAQHHVNANNSLHQSGLLADSISRLSVHM